MFLFNKRQIPDRIFIFDPAVIVVVKFDFGDIELDQTPQKPVNIRKWFEQVDIKKGLIKIIALAVFRHNALFDLAGNQDLLEHVCNVIVTGRHSGILPIDDIHK